MKLTQIALMMLVSSTSAVKINNRAVEKQSPDEIIGMIESFGNNTNGNITYDEFLPFMESQGESNETARIEFDRADTSGDGVITRQEVLDIMERDKAR